MLRHKNIKQPFLLPLFGSLYSIYALYAAGEQAMLYGSIVTFIGWTLYGFVSYKFDLKKITSLIKKEKPT